MKKVKKKDIKSLYYEVERKKEGKKSEWKRLIKKGMEKAE